MGQASQNTLWRGSSQVARPSLGGHIFPGASWEEKEGPLPSHQPFIFRSHMIRTTVMGWECPDRHWLVGKDARAPPQREDQVHLEGLETGVHWGTMWRAPRLWVWAMLKLIRQDSCPLQPVGRGRDQGAGASHRAVRRAPLGCATLPMQGVALRQIADCANEGLEARRLT